MIAAPAAARGATPSIPINAMNSSEYWDYTPDNDVIDAGAIHGQDCSLYLPELRPVTFDCDTEYYYLRPNGKPGNRWFEVGGYVTWTNVRVNPYGAGRSGTPTGYVTDRTSWIRRWHRDRGECMEGIRGFVVSNMPCSTATDAIFHQDKRAGYIAGTGTGSWPWLYEFPCTRAKGWTTCTNKVGDSYRFRGSLIIPR